MLTGVSRVQIGVDLVMPFIFLIYFIFLGCFSIPGAAPFRLHRKLSKTGGFQPFQFGDQGHFEEREYLMSHLRAASKPTRSRAALSI